VKEENLQDLIAEIDRILRQAERALVVSHINPDGDSIGSSLAVAQYLRDLGKEVVLVREDDIPDKYQFLQGADRYPQREEYDPAPSVDTAVVLECPNPDRMGSVADMLGEDTVVVNIDHHLGNTEYGSINWIDLEASSVGEMITRYFVEVGYSMSPATADQLFTAILTDTGRFRFPSTSKHTMEMAGHLIKSGARPHAIASRVYFDMPISTIRLTGRVLNDIEYYDDDRFCFLALTQDKLKESGAEASESEGLVDFVLYGRGVRAGALLKEVDANTTKVSLRSVKEIDVSKVANTFGGGGHINAAGCTLEMPMDQAREEILDLLRQADNGRKD